MLVKLIKIKIYLKIIMENKIFGFNLKNQNYNIKY